MYPATIKGRIILLSVLSIGLIFVLSAFIANWYIVRWLEQNFDSNLLTKAQVLITLFEEDENGLEFEFADEFMPEFERESEPEYFQLWYENGNIFERSHSLEGENLSFSQSQSDDYAFQNEVLRDGREGRKLQLNFTPQLDENLRTETRSVSSFDMVLVVARERESLDRLILIIDLSILFAIIFALLLIYLSIQFAVGAGLQPLEELKSAVRKLDVNHLGEPISVNASATDTESVVAVLNHALARLAVSFKKEQRFASDAAHELKTPISELMNMAEVASKWPDKVEHQEFYDDVLKSSQKMQLIVTSLLNLTKSKDNQLKLAYSSVRIDDKLKQNWQQYSRLAKDKNIQLNLETDPNTVVWSSDTEIDLIVSNLLANAVEYGEENSIVSAVLLTDDQKASLAISNETRSLKEGDLAQMFDSLWRKDASRNSEVHIGMGLTIVKAYADLLGLSVKVALDDCMFTVVISGFDLLIGD